MTSALTSRVSLLSISGIAEKVLVAHGRELARVILPEPNRKQVDDDVRRAVVTSRRPAGAGPDAGQRWRGRSLAVRRPRPAAAHHDAHAVAARADGIINLHGRTDDAAVTRTRQVSTSVEPIRCRPIEPEGTRRSAREPVAGRRMPGETTA